MSLSTASSIYNPTSTVRLRKPSTYLTANFAVYRPPKPSTICLNCKLEDPHRMDERKRDSTRGSSYRERLYRLCRCYSCDAGSIDRRYHIAFADPCLRSKPSLCDAHDDQPVAVGGCWSYLKPKAFNFKRTTSSINRKRTRQHNIDLAVAGRLLERTRVRAGKARHLIRGLGMCINVCHVPVEPSTES